jgi:hypothetical protein
LLVVFSFVVASLLLSVRSSSFLSLWLEDHILSVPKALAKKTFFIPGQVLPFLFSGSFGCSSSFRSHSSLTRFQMPPPDRVLSGDGLLTRGLGNFNPVGGVFAGSSPSGFSPHLHQDMQGFRCRRHLSGGQGKHFLPLSCITLTRDATAGRYSPPYSPMPSFSV